MPAIELTELPRPPAAPSSWELEGILAGSVYTINQPTLPGNLGPPPPSASGNSGGGTLDVVRFLAPVVDDGAPRTLQPFLQRTSALSLSIGGGGFVTRNPNGGENRTDVNLPVGLGANMYVTRWLALTASIGYQYDLLHDVGVDQTTHSMTGSAGFGLRTGDARFDVSYTFTANDVNGSFAPLRWGTIEGTAYAVIERRVALTVWGQALQDGGAGGAGLDVYPTQDFCFFLSGFGARGEVYSQDLMVDRGSGQGGLAYWVTPVTQLGVYYTLTYNDVPLQMLDQVTYGYTQLQHTLALYARLRLP